MDKRGLKILRRNLDAFIKADPIEVTLSRPTKVDAGNGGWKPGIPVTLNPQQMRLVPFKRRVSDDVQNTQDGQLMLAPYILVGRYNIDVQKGDEFTHNDLSYRVHSIEPKSNDRTQTDRVTLVLEVRD